MPRSPRWSKALGDLRAERGRLVVMVGVLALSIVAIGTVLGARTVLRREIVTSYLGGTPSEASLVLEGDVDAALVTAVRAHPGIAAAEARGMLMARVELAPARSRPPSPSPSPSPSRSPAWADHLRMMQAHGFGPVGAWQPLQIFVADEVAASTLDTVHPETGAWPPPPDGLMLERTAAALFGVATGDTITLRTPHGTPRTIAVAGTVHDPGVAPAWQEHEGYAYVSRELLGALGEPPVLHELRVRFTPTPSTTSEADADAQALAAWLTARGHAVRELHVPALREHPHQAQMNTAQLALLGFGVLLLVLSAILIATLLAAILARQVREIGVMKALGADARQLAALYAVVVAAIGTAAFVIAAPLGYLGARAFTAKVAAMMNLAVGDPSIPWWVVGVEALAAVAVPLALAAIPIRRACRLTVRETLAAHGTRGDRVTRARTWLPLAARNALRRPARLALALGLLATGGALSITALDVVAGYRATAASLPDMRHDDLAIVLAEPVPRETLAGLASLANVRVLETWGWARAAFGTSLLARTYPDGGHGSFELSAPPPDTMLVSYPVVAGRWLHAGDTDAIVIDRLHARTEHLAIGDTATLTLPTGTTTWHVVGIVDAIPPNAAFVPLAAFQRVTGTTGRVRELRIAAVSTAGPALPALDATFERELTARGLAIQRAIPFPMLHGAIDDHLVLLTRAVVILAAIIALVGLLGLGATISIGVLERTRELAIMKAIGASGPRIFRLVIGEALAIALAAWLVAVVAAIPATLGVQSLLAAEGFLLGRFVIAPSAIALALAVMVVGSILAAALPARRAAGLAIARGTVTL